MAKSRLPLPLPVQRALRKLGSDIGDARRRRRIKTSVMADRIQVSRMTLHRLERGDASVGMGSYATALYVLGMVDRLAEVANAANDPVGLQLANEDLPRRISE